MVLGSTGDGRDVIVGFHTLAQCGSGEKAASERTHETYTLYKEVVSEEKTKLVKAVQVW